MFYLLCHIHYLPTVFLLPLYSTVLPALFCLNHCGTWPFFPGMPTHWAEASIFFLELRAYFHLLSPLNLNSKTNRQRLALLSDREILWDYNLNCVFCFVCSLTFNGNITSFSLLKGKHIKLNLIGRKKKKRIALFFMKLFLLKTI